MRRARKAMVVAIGVSGLATLAFVLGVRPLRRKSAPHAKVSAPAGGVVEEAFDAQTADEEADGGYLASDGRHYPVRTFPLSLDKVAPRIEDAGMSAALDEVLARTNAELVVNGGFFDPKGRPLGLAANAGTAALSPLVKNLSGGVVTVANDTARLWEAESFVMPEGTPFAIQCRPRLVVGGKPNVKSDDGKRSERTALCLREGGKVLEVAIIHAHDVGEATGPSLFALSRWLVRRGCDDALNLDGGPSTGVAYRENGETKHLAPRAGVRHAIAFVAKQ